jgi:Flp pilus assembly protein TadG
MFRRSDGSVALELALIAPMLIFLFIGIYDMGFLLFQEMQVVTAADAGATYAVAKGTGSYDATKIASAVGATAYPTQSAITGGAAWACACPNGSAGITGVAGTPPNCGSTNCTGTSYPPGVYVLVTAHATPTPIFNWPGYPALVQSGVVVRIQ